MLSTTVCEKDKRNPLLLEKGEGVSSTGDRSRGTQEDTVDTARRLLN